MQKDDAIFGRNIRIDKTPIIQHQIMAKVHHYNAGLLVNNFLKP